MRLTNRSTLRNHVPTNVDSTRSSRLGASATTRHLDPSQTFLRDVRRVGLDHGELAQVIANGVRTRRWDGCVLLRDRFLGIEVELDPSGTIGISARRIS